MNVHPPKLSLRFFRWFCREDYLDEIEGDLTEIFKKEYPDNPRLAKWKFTWCIIKYFRPEFIKSFRNSNSTYDMYQNYFKTAWRNITAKKAYAAINIFGLALGIACALVIFSIVNYHLNFDNFHNDSDRIYRFVTEEHMDQVEYSPSVPPAFGKSFREDYTFGEKVARLCILDDRLITLNGGTESKKFQEDVAFADPELFDIFNLPLVAGKRETLLRDPNTAIISERIAKKYYGNQPAIGQTFRFGNSIEFTITGILKDLPVNTDFRSEIYFSYSTMKQYNEWYAADDSWGGITWELRTFVRLQPGVSAAEVEDVLPNYVKKYRPKSKNVHHYKLQPLNEMHFDGRYDGKMSKTTIWILSSIGLLLVFTACLNFINLATAQAATRAKEVGVRKVLGSVRSQLFWQFTTETGLIVVLATLLAFSVSYLLLPYLNTFFETQIEFNLFSDIRLLLFLVALVLSVTLLSGAYPGIILSRFRPVLALKGKLSGSQGGNFNIRRGLIITQFTISQVLLIGLIVVFFQMRSINSRDMGFEHETVVMLPAGSSDIKLSTLKTQLEAIPNVESVSLCFAAPASDSNWGTSFRYDSRDENENFSISFKGADENYLPTFNIELVAGRNLTPSDTAREFIVNEKMVMKLGLSTPEEILGKSISANGGSLKGPIIGVVKDFHSQSLHSDIQPIFITTSKEFYNEIAVKINMSEASTTLAAVERAWSSTYPELIFQYNFLDDQIAGFYRTEQVMMTLIQIFSGIALVIGCMGLYGLVSFMAVQKTKEIGIRKALGGNTPQILWIFGKEFTRLVLIAFVLAAPIGYLLMSKWLSNYEYQIDFSVQIFLLELVIILGVVLITAGYRSMQAATANPVDSLRSE